MKRHLSRSSLYHLPHNISYFVTGGIMLFTTASKFVPLAAAIITLLIGAAATLEVRQAPGCSPIIVCTPSSTGNTCGTACTCLAVQNVQHLPGVCYPTACVSRECMTDADCPIIEDCPAIIAGLPMLGNLNVTTRCDPTTHVSQTFHEPINRDKCQPVSSRHARCRWLSCTELVPRCSLMTRSAPRILWRRFEGAAHVCGGK
ncbi:hypothetical protein C8Q74DRAFT_132881 [Fomes fomentarius]|nr:hypothetical protein C8Q74DRAFT_132881 [Fomes fomentarius]